MTCAIIWRRQVFRESLHSEFSDLSTTQHPDRLIRLNNLFEHHGKAFIYQTRAFQSHQNEMSVSIDAMSAEKLWSLNRGDAIRIRYFPSSTSKGLIIYHNLPKSVAVAFSAKWAQLFPPLNRKDLRGQHPTELAIRGGCRDAAELILGWMLRCCNGRGLQKWYRYNYDDKPFTKYWNLRNSAAIIGCQYLVSVFDKRLQWQLDHQVHSEDVQAMCNKAEAGEVDPEDGILYTLAEHVAMHIFNNTLKSKPSYDTVREVTPEFNVKVEHYLLPMLEERRATNEAEKQAGLQEQEAETQAEHDEVGTTEEQDPGHKQEEQQAKLQCPIVRVDKRGQAWAKLSLGDIGVANDFRRKEYFGGKTPVRFRGKEGQVKNEQVDKMSPPVAELAKEMPSPNARGGNHNAVGGKNVPGSEGHALNRNARRRARKRLGGPTADGE